MLQSDAVFRCVLYPRGFDHGVLAEEQLVRLQKVDEKRERYVISVAPRGLFSDEDARHRYGGRAADEANAALAKRIGAPLSPEQMISYVGHYFIDRCQLSGLEFEYHLVNLYWFPEGSLTEHYEICVSWNGYDCEKHKRKDERLSIQAELAKLLHGPCRGTAPGEVGRKELLEVDLPTLPRVAA